MRFFLLSPDVYDAFTEYVVTRPFANTCVTTVPIYLTFNDLRNTISKTLNRSNLCQ